MINKKKFIRLLLYAIQYIISIFYTVLLVPKLASIIGVNNFGIIGNYLSVIAVLSVLINYSFTITKVPILSIENNYKYRNEIFSNIIFSKIILSILAIIIFFIYTLNVKLYESKLVLFFISIYLFTFSLNSSWLLQTKKKFNLISLISITTNIVFTITYLIISRVYSVDLFSSLALITGPQILISIITFISCKKHFNINSISIYNSLIEIKSEFKVFLSQILSALYIFTGPLIIFHLYNSTDSGIFSIIDRLIQILAGGFYIIFQLSTPYISNWFISNKKLYRKSMMYIIILYILITSTIFLTSIYYSEIILGYLFKNENVTNHNILGLSLLLVLVSSLGPILTTHYVLEKKQNKILNINSINLTITLLVSFVLVPKFGAIGWIISSIIGQLFIAILLIKTQIKNE